MIYGAAAEHVPDLGGCAQAVLLELLHHGPLCGDRENDLRQPRSCLCPNQDGDVAARALLDKEFVVLLAGADGAAVHRADLLLHDHL